MAAEGREEGQIEGVRKGRTEGAREARAKMVRQILLSRGIEVSAEFPADAAAFSAAAEDVLLAAALACADEADFMRAVVQGITDVEARREVSMEEVRTRLGIE